jgi:NADH-quinone oxidoreductase subunit L
MVLGLGVGAYSAALFHLVTHAFFKACLFLGSGAIIHAMHHEQDMRWMGGLRKQMPWTFTTFTLATLALAGLPLTSGFMSKDAILAGALGFAEVEGGGIFYILPALGFFSAMLTAFYMGRQIWLVFFGESRNHLKPADNHHHGHDAHAAHGDHHDEHDAHHGVHEVSWNMRTPLVVLATLSVFFIYSPDPLDGAKGWFMKLVETPATVVGDSNPQQGALKAGIAATPHAMLPHGAEEEHHAANGADVTHNAGDATEATAHATTEGHGEAHGGHTYADPRQAEIIHAGHAAHYTAIYISSLMVVLGISLALIVYVFRIIDPDKTASAIRPLYLYSFNKWYWDEIYQATFIKGSLVIAKVLSWFDATIVDGIVNSTATLVRKISILSGGIDKHVVDGMVNFTAFAVNTTGALFRKLQTGKVQTYVVMLLVIVFGYFVVYLSGFIS